MNQTSNDRRRHPRKKARGPIAASTVVPPIPLTDAEVIDVSTGGIAIRTRVPVKPGDRMSFRVPAQGLTLRVDGGGGAPILAVVVACDPMEGGFYRVRCRALLGAFEAA